MRSRATDSRSAAKCQEKWPDQSPAVWGPGFQGVVRSNSPPCLNQSRSAATNYREPVWAFLGGLKLSVRLSRRQRSSTLAVVGICLGVYVVAAMAFNWLIEPMVAKSREAAA